MYLILIAKFLLGVASPDKTVDVPFQAGEVIRYKLNYGWFSIGNGAVTLTDSLANSKRYFYVNARASSSGFLNLFAKVNDEWGALVHVNDLLPVLTFRNIREGGYFLREEVWLDQHAGEILVKSVKPHRTPSIRPDKHFAFDPEVDMYDFLSGLLKLRSLQLSELKLGDSIRMQGFFEDTFYDFHIAYQGLKTIKTKMGKLEAHELQPVVPKNSTFDGEQSITAWFSNDSLQLPVKVAAKMFLGKVSCEIVGYERLNPRVN